MKTRLYKQLLFIFTLYCSVLSFLSCTERIDIMTEASAPHLVIYGYITTDTTSHAIKITRSSGYFATTSPEGISNAVVSIKNGEDVFLLTEDAKQPGLYLTEPDVYGIEGETYTLNVSVDFEGSGNMEEYTATSLLPYSVRMDSIDLQPSDIFDDRIDILFYGALPESDENYMSFQAYRNGVLLTDSLINFALADDEFIDVKELEAVRCMNLDQEEEQYVIKKGDTVTLQVNSITKEYSDFIWNAQMELYGSNPIFGGPPANIEPNIQAVRSGNTIPISGFFTAYSYQRKSTIYKGD